MQEKINFLKEVLEHESRDRLKHFKELPEELFWMVHCKKTQLLAAILKLMLDEDQQNLIFWPSRVACPHKCDFCILGSTTNVFAFLHPYLLQFDVDIVAWWKRYVRYALPVKKFQSELFDQPLHCFILLNRPTFLQQYFAIECDEIDRPIDEVTGKKIYLCKKCLQPKKGHICIHDPDEKLSHENQLSEHMYENENFVDIFVEEKNSQSQIDSTEFSQVFVADDRPSRLENIFTKNFSTSTIISRQVINTDIDFE